MERKPLHGWALSQRGPRTSWGGNHSQLLLSSPALLDLSPFPHAKALSCLKAFEHAAPLLPEDPVLLANLPSAFRSQILGSLIDPRDPHMCLTCWCWESSINTAGPHTARVKQNTDGRAGSYSGEGQGQEEGAVKEDRAGGTAGTKALRQATAWLLGELEGPALKCGREGTTGGGWGKRQALKHR